jgi:signal transduction histidine kinase
MRFLVLIIFIICNYYLSAQQPPDIRQLSTLWQKTEAWRGYCNELIGKGEQKANIQLTYAAKQGIAMVPKDSVRYRAMFSLFAGCAYKNLKQYDSAILYLEQSRELALSYNKISYQITAIQQLDNVYAYTNNTVMRNRNMARINSIADTSNDLKVKSIATDMLGAYYKDINNYEKSLEYKLKYISVYKELIKIDTFEDPINIGFEYSNIANLLNEMGQHAKALPYLTEARTYIGDRIMKGTEETLYLFYIDSYTGLNNYDSAHIYYDSVYIAMGGRDTLFNVLSTANMLMGEFYLDKSSLDTALYYANQASRTGKLSNNTDNSIMAAKLLGNIYYLQGHYRQAINMINSALNNSFEFDKGANADMHKILADSYAKTKQWDSAFNHFQIYSALRDTIALAEANKNFADAEARFQNKEKADQIANQRLQINYAKKQQQWLIGGIALAGLIAILTLIIYQNKRKTARALQKLNAQLEESNNTKAKLFSIISHDLRTPISHVYQYLTLQQPDNNNKIESATASLLETMEDLLLWSKTQMNAFQLQPRKIWLNETLQPVVDLLKLNAERKQVNIEYAISDDQTTHTDSDFLQTIVRNLLQNAIKAAPEHSIVSITAASEPGKCVIRIINQGETFTNNNFVESLERSKGQLSANGMGLQLVKELADKAKIGISFTSNNGQGTVAAVSIPA